MPNKVKNFRYIGTDRKHYATSY